MFTPTHTHTHTHKGPWVKNIAMHYFCQAMRFKIFRNRECGDFDYKCDTPGFRVFPDFRENPDFGHVSEFALGGSAGRGGAPGARRCVWFDLKWSGSHFSVYSIFRLLGCTSGLRGWDCMAGVGARDPV